MATLECTHVQNYNYTLCTTLVHLQSTLHLPHGNPAGTVRWRLEYRHMASPAARLLAPAGAADVAAPAPAGQAAFALFGKTGRSPRVYCCRQG